MSEQSDTLDHEIDELKQQLGAKQNELSKLNNQESVDQRVIPKESLPE